MESDLLSWAKDFKKGVPYEGQETTAKKILTLILKMFADKRDYEIEDEIRKCLEILK